MADAGAAAVPRGWGVLALTARDDYFERWNDIRRQGPVLDVGDGVYLVTGWAAAHAGLRHPSTGAGQGVAAAFGLGSPVEQVVRNWLMSLDGDRHRRARGLVSRVFAPRAIAALEPVIRGIARGLVAGYVDRASAAPQDFAREVAARLPCEAIRVLFGLSAEMWAAHVEPLFLAPDVHALDGYAAVAGLTHTFTDLLAEADGAGEQGALIGLLRTPGPDGDRLDDLQVAANCVLIVTAAIDTTAGLIANTMLRLSEHPDAAARVGGEPRLIPAAIEETLRHCPSAPSSTRQAVAALELGGLAIPAGADLFFSFAAANRDPAKFADPDRFDLDRDAAALLTFGGGAHFCLGAGLARMEARVLLEELFALAGDFRLAEAIRWRDDNPVVRAPRQLMLTCRRRA